MATNYKILAQSNPAATTQTTILTVGNATQAVISTVTIANLSATATTFRLAAIPSGSTLSNARYIGYDLALPANDTVFLTLGIALGAGDSLSVYAGSANVCFSVFGSEIV
jgi:hypothetical protein